MLDRGSRSCACVGFACCQYAQWASVCISVWIVLLNATVAASDAAHAAAHVRTRLEESCVIHRLSTSLIQARNNELLPIYTNAQLITLHDTASFPPTTLLASPNTQDKSPANRLRYSIRAQDVRFRCQRHDRRHRWRGRPRGWPCLSSLPLLHLTQQASWMQKTLALHHAAHVGMMASPSCTASL